MRFLSACPRSHRTDLDAELRVLNSAQTQLAIANPAANAAGRLTFSVGAQDNTRVEYPSVSAWPDAPDAPPHHDCPVSSSSDFLP